MTCDPRFSAQLLVLLSQRDARILELEAAARTQAAAAAASMARAADNSDAIQNALDLAREQLQQKTDELACLQVLDPSPTPPFAFSTAATVTTAC